ncbi:MAG: polyprenyl synthetase family protein [Candidatus Omnitrophica bacterium]|nr:polyprenyl synthetase family protein [Candidatus Omnitrophota bacterium]MDD5441471.1 polyprenyl synthetase family protein [Candidatus Omnitrophota bacterium]
MFSKEQKKINEEIPGFFKNIDKTYSLSKISPLIFKALKTFTINDGKRIRPIMFITGFKGFTGKKPKNLYTAALSIELMHNFMLIHDDIIDKSDLRRGKPSMHAAFNSYLKKYPDKQFSGQDLAIIAGDVMYAIAFNALTSIDANPKNKESALREFIKAAIYTGCGEFIEIISGAKKIKDITLDEIFKIYDYKTSNYTFASPLCMGAYLADAPKKEIEKLYKIGIYTGRGFQIKDDVLSMFHDEKTIGKSVLSDLQESKKTFLIWHIYNNSNKNVKKEIEKILNKKNVTHADLHTIREIAIKTDTLNKAKKETEKLFKKAQKILQTLQIKTAYKKNLSEYIEKILSF